MDSSEMWKTDVMKTFWFAKEWKMHLIETDFLCMSKDFPYSIQPWKVKTEAEDASQLITNILYNIVHVGKKRLNNEIPTMSSLLKTESTASSVISQHN